MTDKEKPMPFFIVTPSPRAATQAPRAPQSTADFQRAEAAARAATLGRRWQDSLAMTRAPITPRRLAFGLASRGAAWAGRRGWQAAQLTALR